MSNLIFTELHEGLMLHYMMLTRQITSLSDSLLHIIRLHTRTQNDQEKYKGLFRGYSAYAQTELADVVCQVKKICNLLQLSFEETAELGDAREDEKMKEFKKKYPTDKWI